MGIDAKMYFKTKSKPTKKDILNLAVRLHDCFKDAVSVSRPGKYSWNPKGSHCLEIVNEYIQDGPEIYPEKDETLVQVELVGRYYDSDYERGDITSYISIAKWIEINVPDAEVFYGGDSSGVCAYRFDKECRDGLFKHFASCGHLDYVGFMGANIGDKDKLRFCDFCETNMVQYGFGRDYAAFRCVGCDFKEETRDGGISYQEVKK